MVQKWEAWGEKNINISSRTSWKHFSIFLGVFNRFIWCYMASDIASQASQQVGPEIIGNSNAAMSFMSRTKWIHILKT